MNIQGALNNIDELKYVLKKRKPDICLINETHITLDTDLNALQIANYQLHCCFSHSKHTGGVSAYINKRLKIDKVSTFNNEFAWLLSFEISLNNERSTIAGVYLSPSVNKTFVLETLEYWCNELSYGNSIVICGDFNVDISNTNANSKKIDEICKNNGLKQLISCPTRITETTSTIIDLCLTNIHSNKITCNVLNDDQISDHLNLEITLFGNTKKSNIAQKEVICWRNYDENIFYDSIYTWHQQWDLIRSHSLQTKFEWLLENLMQSLQQFRTTKIIKLNNDFFDNELETMRCDKNILYKRAQYSTDSNDWQRFKDFRIQYKKLIQQKKYEFNQKKLNRVYGDNKGTWKVLNDILNRNTNEDICLKINESIIDEKNELANEFNSFFVNSIIELNAAIPEIQYVNDIEYEIDSPFIFRKITIRDMKKCLYEITKNNTDEFNLNTKILLDAINLIGIQLAELINDSYSLGIFPDILKKSTITPIRKITGTTNINEFRPLNTLPSVEKLIEKLTFEQLNYYVHKNNIINKYQSGFRANYSCESAINELLYEFKQAQSKFHVIIAVFLDFQRAFETIDPIILLDKLKKYGIQNNENKWFESYLLNRRQNVKIDNCKSNEITNNLGVPQGSILGPLLFLIYINDIGNCLEFCQIRMFADDTLIFVAEDNIDEAIVKINTDLDSLYHKICMNKLKLNIRKTKVLIIDNKNSLNKYESNIKINNVNLDIVDHVKYLGVIIDENLSFKNHLSYISGKIGSKINVLSRLRNELNCQQKITIYKSIIEPHFTYCASIIFLLTDNDFNRLQILQNKCMRTILKAKKDTHIKTMLNILNFTKIKDMVQMYTMIFIHKILNNLTPMYLREKIKFAEENERKSTLRSRNDIIIENFTKKCTQNSLFYSGLRMYNSLPSEIKDEKSIHKFKSKLKYHMSLN